MDDERREGGAGGAMETEEARRRRENAKKSEVCENFKVTFEHIYVIMTEKQNSISARGAKKFFRNAAR